MSGKRAGILALFAAIVVLAGSSAWAVDEPVVGHISFGASLPQGDTGDFLEDGWAIHGGATWFSPTRPAFGLRLDFGIDWYDIKGEILDQIDTNPDQEGVQRPDNGYARAWSGTVDVVWNPRTDGAVGWYLLAGAGIYYTKAELSENGYTTGYWCDPWWGICYPGIYEGEYLVDSASNWEWGLNAGAGLTFKVGAESEMYLEAVYHWIDTENGSEIVPVSLGVRW